MEKQGQKRWSKLKDFLLKKKNFNIIQKITFDLFDKKQETVENFQTQIQNSENNNKIEEKSHQSQTVIKYNYYQNDENEKLINKQKKIQASIIQQQSEISLNELKQYNSEKIDSTGVQLWPAEEVLAYFCLKKIKQFKNQSIIELGAGYSGLAGILLAKFLLENQQQTNLNLKITDGNSVCAKHLQKNIEINFQLIWDVNYTSNEKYNRIIIADCLFFKQYHQALVETLANLLDKQNGVIYIIGPKRGDSMDIFLKLSEKYFSHQFIAFNDEKYQQQQEKQQQLNDYDPDKNQLYFIQLEFKKILDQ
ncbi:hypothetical protein PPERSA_02547 [Pseudocohnilembus persalinus]|uniref:Calmodulin-lysine N-methyltransferase n=1 Tax=Pseudocohnilembus persalinus TaxID=266149 RepID=A0A0V0R5B6_PSEPJ|nr:hypothetical protein PPERSA_02547 [Pseudocohnilembus persalinus]|eukprot:KRX09675.1 hypothetical protein PPERSA_02547 [Pseudocohnilembus persalinus]